MNAWMGLDTQIYAEKPKNRFEYNEIRKRAANNWNSYDVTELAMKIGQNGHSFVPGHLVDGVSSSNCMGMQAFALDFDNDKIPVSVHTVIDRCQQYSLSPAFAYHTLSSTEDQNRFRLVFIAEDLITDHFLIPVIYRMLLTVFPEADHSCRDHARVFLGGKELIFCEENARLNMRCLCDAAEQELCSDVSHRKERIGSFTNAAGIQKINDMPAMGPMDRLSLFFRDFTVSAINKYIHIVGETTESRIFILEKSSTTPNNPTCGDKTLHKVSEGCISACPLLQEFYAGEHLDHDSRFFLLTNLIHIKGGVAKFRETLAEYYDPDSLEKWDREIQYARFHNYHPAMCDTFCPYAAACDHDATPVQTLLCDRKVFRLSEPKYYTLEEAEQQLEENIASAMQSDRCGIHLIRAQTGLGKTRAYTEMLAKDASMKAIIALPTNRLKEEVHQRLISLGVSEEDIFITPQVKDNPFVPIDVQETVSARHEQGIHDQTKEIISAYAESADLLGKYAQTELSRIVHGVKEYRNERIILTTHAYLLYIPGKYRCDKTVIIDEDILLNLFFNRIYTFDAGELGKLKALKSPGYRMLGTMISEAPYEVYSSLYHAAEITEAEKKELEELNADGNLLDLNHAASFVKHRNPDGSAYVRYFCRTTLPFNKYIVLTATPDVMIYRRYFHPLNVIDYPYKEAENQGKLTQYTYHSLGRKDLDERMESVFSFASNHFKGSKAEVITFKKLTDNNTVKKENLSPSLHYGNTMGFNELSGHNLAVIGTYFKQEDAYKLIAAALGENIKKENKSPRQRRVEYNNYSFVLMTYADSLLQRIQLYSIWSEQEQSVGRARLLRNDCEVLLLSAFPCSQARLNTREYLAESVPCL